jgi:hypothetical protein|tara:strand:+ start:1314 stop:1451 length:138 start_codon:yes stop_codon:yes gene_type:complete
MIFDVTIRVRVEAEDSPHVETIIDGALDLASQIDPAYDYQIIEVE